MAQNILEQFNLKNFIDFATQNPLMIEQFPDEIKNNPQIAKIYQDYMQEKIDFLNGQITVADCLNNLISLIQDDLVNSFLMVNESVANMYMQKFITLYYKLLKDCANDPSETPLSNHQENLRLQGYFAPLRKKNYPWLKTLESKAREVLKGYNDQMVREAIILIDIDVLNVYEMQTIPSTRIKRLDLPKQVSENKDVRKALVEGWKKKITEDLTTAIDIYEINIMEFSTTYTSGRSDFTKEERKEISDTYQAVKLAQIKQAYESDGFRAGKNVETIKGLNEPCFIKMLYLMMVMPEYFDIAKSIIDSTANYIIDAKEKGSNDTILSSENILCRASTSIHYKPFWNELTKDESSNQRITKAFEKLLSNTYSNLRGYVHNQNIDYFMNKIRLVPQEMLQDKGIMESIELFVDFFVLQCLNIANVHKAHNLGDGVKMFKYLSVWAKILSSNKPQFDKIYEGLIKVAKRLLGEDFRSYYYSIPNGIIERMSDTVLEIYLEKLQEDQELCSACPDHLLGNSKVKEICSTKWDYGLLYNSPWLFDECPEEIKQREDLQKAVKEGWENIVSLNLKDFPHPIPPQFQKEASKTKSIKMASILDDRHTELWSDLLMSHPEYLLHLPEGEDLGGLREQIIDFTVNRIHANPTFVHEYSKSVVQIPEIKKALSDSCLKSFKDIENLDMIPEIALQDPVTYGKFKVMIVKYFKSRGLQPLPNFFGESVFWEDNDIFKLAALSSLLGVPLEKGISYNQTVDRFGVEEAEKIWHERVRRTAADRPLDMIHFNWIDFTDDVIHILVKSFVKLIKSHFYYYLLAPDILKNSPSIRNAYNELKPYERDAIVYYGKWSNFPGASSTGRPDWWTQDISNRRQLIKKDTNDKIYRATTEGKNKIAKDWLAWIPMESNKTHNR